MKRTKRKINQGKHATIGTAILLLNILMLILFTGVWSSYPEKGIMLTAILNMLVAVVVMIGEAEG